MGTPGTGRACGHFRAFHADGVSPRKRGRYALGNPLFLSTHGAVRAGSDPLALPRIKVEGGEPLWLFRMLARGGMDHWRVVDNAIAALTRAGRARSAA
jgi:hypothetical protein